MELNLYDLSTTIHYHPKTMGSLKQPNNKQMLRILAFSNLVKFSAPNDYVFSLP